MSTELTIVFINTPLSLDIIYGWSPKTLTMRHIPDNSALSRADSSPIRAGSGAAIQAWKNATKSGCEGRYLKDCSIWWNIGCVNLLKVTILQNIDKCIGSCRYWTSNVSTSKECTSEKWMATAHARHCCFWWEVAWVVDIHATYLWTKREGLFTPLGSIPTLASVSRECDVTSSSCSRPLSPCLVIAALSAETIPSKWESWVTVLQLEKFSCQVKVIIFQPKTEWKYIFDSWEPDLSHS